LRVGADVFAKCRRCGEVWHVVVAVVPNRKTRVECKQCGGRHGYSPPAESAATQEGRKSSPVGPRGGRKKKEPVIAPNPSLPVRPYNQSDQYTTGDRILHPNFGEGVVQSISGPKKLRILFASGERTLAQRQKA
jgi:ribosomal protein L37E